MHWDDQQARMALRAMFDAAAASADPHQVLAAYLLLCSVVTPSGRVVVIGAGKPVSVIAAALADAWPDMPASGTVITRHGHAAPAQRGEVLQASHPVLQAAARRMLDAVAGSRPGDLVRTGPTLTNVNDLRAILTV